MRRFWTGLTIVVASASIQAETITIDATGHYTRINEPEYMELEDDHELYPGYRRHIAVTGGDGSSESHWCFGSNVMDDSRLAFGGGYCTALDEDGDVYWLWFELMPTGGFGWTVMGGTGKYDGATGSGTSRATVALPDGSATLAIQGEIELAGN